MDLALDLPPAIPPPPGTKVKEPTLINIQQGGALFIGEKPTTIDTLITDVTRELTLQNEMGPDARVYIRADRTVKYGDFMNVMNTLQDGGFYQVALINEEL